MTTYATRPIADEARPSTPAPTSK
ncbi:MAG: hypothetical protein RL590_1406, partial [Actinomycetota bacterium]